MGKTIIEWCDTVWNPVTGCSPISEGCKFCYAKRMSNRLKGRFGYPEDDPFKVTFHPDRLDQPLKWNKSRRIFVCSMGDLFHENVEYHQINEIFGMMYKCDHTFLLLTKRPKRMYDFLDNHIYMGAYWFALDPKYHANIWLGITAENQQCFDERWLILAQIPAAKRFVSIEPMLEDVNIDIFAPWPDWVIVGGLSLPGGKIQAPKREWVDSIVEQCSDAGVPIFLKPNAQYPIERREFPDAGH